MRPASRAAARAALAFALAAACLAGLAASPVQRRTLGFSVAAEGYGEGTGVEAGELAALGLVLEPFRWPFLAPTVSAIASVPAFPWDPGRSLLEARLDLRLASVRSGAIDRLAREPALYAPALSASWLIPLGPGGSLAAAGARPLVLRMGDGIYSILSPALILDPSDGLRPLGYSIELFEFSYFLF
ncbi:MAG TPA: hypothetical protein P5133_00135 [Spirochaetia bacterium]|nr:hypothetical protein [Spirochaetia bacterium]